MRVCATRERSSTRCGTVPTTRCGSRRTASASRCSTIPMAPTVCQCLRARRSTESIRRSSPAIWRPSTAVRSIALSPSCIGATSTNAGLTANNGCWQGSCDGTARIWSSAVIRTSCSPSSRIRRLPSSTRWEISSRTSGGVTATADCWPKWKSSSALRRACRRCTMPHRPFRCGLPCPTTAPRTCGL